MANKNPFQLIKEQHDEWEENKEEWARQKDLEEYQREAEFESKELGGGWH